MNPLREWLESIGLAMHADLFEREQVDMEAARQLTEQHLKEMGLPIGHRVKFLAAVSAHVGEAAASSSPTTDVHSASPPSVIEQGERRQLTVLFCDMVGFTELANRVDPEVLQRIIRSYEDACAVCITRYEGYVFQRLGDGIVAFFGYPLAHEGEAERAIRVGLEIIESLTKLDVPDAGHQMVAHGFLRRPRSVLQFEELSFTL